MSAHDSLESSLVGGIEDTAITQKRTQVLVYLKNAINKPIYYLTDHEFKSLDFIATNCKTCKNAQNRFTLSYELIEKLYSEIESMALSL